MSYSHLSVFKNVHVFGKGGKQTQAKGEHANSAEGGQLFELWGYNAVHHVHTQSQSIKPTEKERSMQ